MDCICFNDSFQIQLLKFSIADHLFMIINYVISVLSEIEKYRYVSINNGYIQNINEILVCNYFFKSFIYI